MPPGQDIVRIDGKTEDARWVALDEKEFPTIEEAIGRGLVELSLPIDQLGEGTKYYRHDPEEAKRLLAEAGFASPDHPITDAMIDHPLDHNRNRTDRDRTNGDTR